MKKEILQLLRCSFCGTNISVANDAICDENNGSLWTAILGCECCAYPLVDGIPVLLANDRTRQALRALDANDIVHARQILLELDDASAHSLSMLIDNNRTPTYRELLEAISDDAETDYFLYRFSDPTYRSADAIIRALTAHHNYSSQTAVLDLCGGSGHLTRSLLARPEPGETVLADLYYWKLWVAARTTAIGSTGICCDASNPLPFASGSFSSVVLSDAFPYIWHKRLCADEMMRVATAEGIIVMPHLHSALGENMSAGNTLTPASYQRLFSQRKARLFDDKILLDDLLGNTAIDLMNDIEPCALGKTPAITLIATHAEWVFKRHNIQTDLNVRGRLIVNPLYKLSYRNRKSHLTLQFPTPEYGEEYKELQRYLPDKLVVSADLRSPLNADEIGIEYGELRRQCVLLDVPNHYC